MRCEVGSGVWFRCAGSRGCCRNRCRPLATALCMAQCFTGNIGWDTGVPRCGIFPGEQLYPIGVLQWIFSRLPHGSSGPRFAPIHNVKERFFVNPSTTPLRRRGSPHARRFDRSRPALLGHEKGAASATPDLSRQNSQMSIERQMASLSKSRINRVMLS